MKKCPDLMEPYDWWNYSAPVCPPTWVKRKLKEKGCFLYSLDWHNVFWDGQIVAAIFYRTRLTTLEEDEEGFVTFVLPGSYEVSKTRWLQMRGGLG